MKKQLFLWVWGMGIQISYHLGEHEFLPFEPFFSLLWIRTRHSHPQIERVTQKMGDITDRWATAPINGWLGGYSQLSLVVHMRCLLWVFCKYINRQTPKNEGLERMKWFNWFSYYYLDVPPLGVPRVETSSLGRVTQTWPRIYQQVLTRWTLKRQLRKISQTLVEVKNMCYIKCDQWWIFLGKPIWP